MCAFGNHHQVKSEAMYSEIDSESESDTVSQTASEIHSELEFQAKLNLETELALGDQLNAQFERNYDVATDRMESLIASGIYDPGPYDTDDLSDDILPESVNGSDPISEPLLEIILDESLGILYIWLYRSHGDYIAGNYYDAADSLRSNHDDCIDQMSSSLKTLIKQLIKDAYE